MSFVIHFAGGRNMRFLRVLAFAVVLCLSAGAGSAIGQTNPPGIPQWAVIAHQLALRAHGAGFPGSSPTGAFPPVIPKYLPSLNSSGVAETYNLAAPTITGTNPFFQAWEPMAAPAPRAMNPEARGVSALRRFNSVSWRAMGRIRSFAWSTERPAIPMT
jgi:hypothetical protein